MIVRPPRHLVWSTNTLDLSDPFQKRRLLRQTLMPGRAEDVRMLELEKIRRELDQLDLPKEIEILWRRYLEYLDARDNKELRDFQKSRSSAFYPAVASRWTSRSSRESRP